MKGKNKLVPRLLGITKECVMRVDEKTKEVIQEWNLTNIKRWAASPKSFTLVSPGAQRESAWGFQRRGSRRGLRTSLGAGAQLRLREQGGLWNRGRTVEVRGEAPGELSDT